MIFYERLHIDSTWIIQNSKEYKPLKEHTKQSTILVLFYPQHYCGECFQGDLLRFNDISKKFENKTLIISTLLTKRDLFFWKKENDIFAEAYQIKTKQNTLFQEVLEPCFFVLNKDMNVHLFFNPDPDLPDLSDWYFNKIENLLENL